MEAQQKRITALSKVFISYKRDCDDQDLAKRLEEDLRNDGVDVWRDETSIDSGRIVVESIETGIETCNEFLVILSPEAVASDWVIDELHEAREKKKLIIPLLNATCKIPMGLKRVQYVDFREDYKTAYAKLINAPPPPLVWLRRILNFFERTWGRMLAAVLVIALAFAAWWFLAPSKTTSEVIGAEVLSQAGSKDMRGPIPAIKVQFDNDGGRPSTLAGEYRLTFPPEIPFAPQPLKLAEKSPEEVPGRGHLVIKLTASGLESKQLPDGSFPGCMRILTLLPGRRVTLHYRIKESSGANELRSEQFSAELLNDLVWLRSRADDPEEENP
jgi:hypothetical protein